MSVVTLSIKFEGKDYPIELSDELTVGDLKLVVKEKTSVQPERQKLLGLKYMGKTPTDEIPLSQLKLKTNQKIMLMGTREEDIPDVPEGFEDTDVVNDLDYKETSANVTIRPENLNKIQNRVDKIKIEIMNPPRPGKKLLVLDIDYTLFDHRSVVQHPLQQMRPYLHEFLTSAYKNYDIVIWSATSMRWIELKMKELGVTTNPNYKILCFMDNFCMITVLHEKYGVVKVKPLGSLWGKPDFSPYYNPKNTIMFDDLRRNFLMNPQNGLKIPPFKNCHTTGKSDEVLLQLAKYLDIINEKEDLVDFDHDDWERTIRHYERKQKKQ